MPIVCTVCRHERRLEIDEALLAGEPFRTLEKRTGTSAGALFRHRHEHISAALLKAKEAAEQVEAGTLFERLRALNQETQAILREARESGNNVIALQAIGRAEKQLELEARLLGELDERVQVAVGLQVESTAAENRDSLLAEVLTLEELEAIEQRFLAAHEKKVDHGPVVELNPFKPINAPYERALVRKSNPVRTRGT